MRRKTIGIRVTVKLKCNLELFPDTILPTTHTSSFQAPCISEDETILLLKMITQRIKVCKALHKTVTIATSK